MLSNPYMLFRFRRASHTQFQVKCTQHCPGVFRLFVFCVSVKSDFWEFVHLRCECGKIQLNPKSPDKLRLSSWIFQCTWESSFTHFVTRHEIVSWERDHTDFNEAYDEIGAKTNGSLFWAPKLNGRQHLRQLVIRAIHQLNHLREGQSDKQQ